MEEKLMVYLEVHQLKKQKMRVAQIAKKLKISRTTVYKYLQMTFEDVIKEFEPGKFTDYEGKEVSVATSLRNVTAEKVAVMYKSRWTIETFFRWIKQNLNIPVLFGTTKNAVFNQLFAALIAYVVLKWLHVKGGQKRTINSVSFAGFQRLLLCGALPIEWRISLTEQLERYKVLFDWELDISG